MNTKRFLLINDIQPEPWTVPDLSMGRAKGKMYPIASKKQPLRDYQAQIEENVKTAYPDLEMYPDDVDLQLEVMVWRLREVYETASGQHRVRQEADATNLLKATEDALQGILYKNDRQIKKSSCEIIEQGRETRSGLLIVVRPHVLSYEFWAEMRNRMENQPRPAIPGNVTLVETPDGPIRPSELELP